MPPNLLSPETFEELSLVFGEKSGRTWAPRNQSSRVLAIKGGAVDQPAKPSFLDRFVKSWLLPDSVQIVDNIDNDGDGNEDYDQIINLMTTAYYDISAAYSVSGDTARAALVVAAVDTFLANLDDVRSGGDGKVRKAGKRHSAGTKRSSTACARR